MIYIYIYIVVLGTWVIGLADFENLKTIFGRQKKSI